MHGIDIIDEHLKQASVPDLYILLNIIINYTSDSVTENCTRMPTLNAHKI